MLFTEIISFSLAKKAYLCIMENHKVLAIIDSNMLSCIGLQRILNDIVPMFETQHFSSFEEMQAADQGQFAHFFVASRFFFEHTTYFRNNNRRAIVMVNGDMQIAGMLTLNVCQPEHRLVASILALHSRGHAAIHSHPIGGMCHPDGMPPAGTAHPGITHVSTPPLLSPREVEVAVLLSKGLINKEIADQLNISLTTVITHRKNIMEKLHATSLANIIVYTIMNGMVEVGEIQ